MNEKRSTLGQSKLSSRTVIGIDLDNTLVCYDELFYSAARQQGLIKLRIPKSKETIRDTVRLLSQGEEKWTRLQAVVYGAQMGEAAAFEGSEDFLRHCSVRGSKTVIISHRRENFSPQMVVDFPPLMFFSNPRARKKSSAFVLSAARISSTILPRFLRNGISRAMSLNCSSRLTARMR